MNEKKMKRNTNNTSVKAALSMAAFFCFFCMNSMYVLASDLNFGENIANWALDQLFWIVLLLGIFFAAMAGIKRAWVACVSIGVGTAIILFFIKNPTSLETLGNKLAEIVGLV